MGALREPAHSGSLRGNLAALYAAYGVNYLFPLALIPFLSRTLGVQAFGLYAFADGCGRTLSVLLEYGMHLSGTREVATHRQDRRQLGEVVAGVLGLQVLLALAAVTLVAILAWTTIPFRQSALLLPGAVMWAVCTALWPIWYHQGVEKPARIVFLDAAAKVVGLCGIFVLVKSPEHAWRVLTIQGLVALVSTIAAYYLVWREAEPVFPTGGMILRAYRAGLPVFLSKASVLLYTAANPIIISFLAPLEVVGYFAGAERICRAAVNTMHPMNQSFYPRMVGLLASNVESAAIFAVKTARIMCCYAAVLFLGLWFGADVIVRVILGGDYAPVSLALRVLSLVPLANAISNSFGLQWMLALRMDRAYLLAVLAGSALNLVLMPALFGPFGLRGLGASVVAAETMTAAIILLALNSKRRDPFRLARTRVQPVQPCGKAPECQ